MHSDLGRVVQAIIREFSKNPPQLLEEISPGSVKSHRGTYIFILHMMRAKNQNFCYYYFIIRITDSQGRNSPSYSLQQYPEITLASYNSYYNTQYPQYSSTNANTCIYNYNHTNSGTVYVTENHTKFGSPSQHSAYVATSRSGSLHNTDATRYNSNQHGTYLNSHYVNANYHQQSLPNQAQIKLRQSIAFPELNNLSNEELRWLSEDDDRLDEFLDKHSDLKDINMAIDDAIDWVQKTAGKIICDKTMFFFWISIFFYLFLRSQCSQRTRA